MHDACAPFTVHDGASLRHLLAGALPVRLRLGGAPERWRMRAAGSGALNRVTIVEGTAGAVAVKQPLAVAPDDAPPLPASRLHFEGLALTEMARIAPANMPRLVHYDPGQGLIVLEALAEAVPLPVKAEQGESIREDLAAIGRSLARIAVSTSDFALPIERRQGMIALFAGNAAMALMRDRALAAPAEGAAGAALRRLRHQLVGHQECLLHGAATLNRILSGVGQTILIAPESACVGPIGYDIGALLGDCLVRLDGAEAREAAATLWRAFEGALADGIEAHAPGDSAAVLAAAAGVARAAAAARILQAGGPDRRRLAGAVIGLADLSRISQISEDIPGGSAASDKAR